MKNPLKYLLDPSLLRFLCVGVLNTAASALIMFGLYNLLRLDSWQPWGYWISSAAAYVLSSALSFALNRRFTFRHKGPVLRSAVRFALVIAVCYGVAFKAAQPLSGWLLARLLAGRAVGRSLSDQVSMLVGMALFTLMNYFGQRFFAFRNPSDA